MRLRTLMLGLFLAGSLQAGTITLDLANLAILGPGANDVRNGVTSLPLSGDLGDGSWTFTAALTTNLVPTVGRFATASPSIDVHFTDLTLTCAAQGSCFGTDFAARMDDQIWSPAGPMPYTWDVSLQGTGPDADLNVYFDDLHMESSVSGPTYSFDRSGTVVPGGNFYLTMDLGLTNFSYPQGTVLSLADSLDFTLTPTPEPATLSLLAAGIGLAGCALRRRSKRSA